MKFICAVAIASTVIVTPLASHAAPDSEVEIVRERIQETRGNRTRNIGIMAGARAYCGYDPDPFLTNYKMHLGMNYQAPQMLWDRLVKGANRIITTLDEAKVPCTDDFKTYLEGLTY